MTAPLSGPSSYRYDKYEEARGRPYDKPSDNDAECFCGVDDHLTIQITERNGAAMFYDDSQGSSGV